MDNENVVEADLVLFAAGRVPVLPKIENIELEMDGKFIKTDENFRTNIKNIFAIGDVNGKIQLAHAATHQALGAVDFITRNDPIHFDVLKIPSVVYGNPEIAWVGKTEKQLGGIDYRVSCFPVAALGKAQADDEIDGFIKVLSVDGKIAGAHIVSPEASALIQQFIGNINNFNVIYFLTAGGPNNPELYNAGDTDLLVTWLFNLTTSYNDYSLAATIGILVFIFCATLSLITFNMTKSSKNEEEFS